jgi:hypothetical protein
LEQELPLRRSGVRRPLLDAPPGALRLDADRPRNGSKGFAKPSGIDAVLCIAAIDHRHDLRRAVGTERSLKAKAKLSDFVRRHPRLFDANLSV